MLKYQLVQDTYFSMTAKVNTDKEFIYFPLKLSARSVGTEITINIDVNVALPSHRNIPHLLWSLFTTVLLLRNILKQAHINEITEKGTCIPYQNIYDKLNSVK